MARTKSNHERLLATVEATYRLAERSFDALHAAAKGAALERALGHAAHVVHVERLGDVIVGAGPDGFDDGADGGRGADHDDGHVGVDVLHLLEEGQAVLVGHDDVEQDEVHLLLEHDLQGVEPIL